jgi:hypothetical protein
MFRTSWKKRRNIALAGDVSCRHMVTRPSRRAGRARTTPEGATTGSARTARQPAVQRRLNGNSTAAITPPPAEVIAEHERKGDAVVLVTQHPTTCVECSALLIRGELVHFEAQRALCLRCALLDRLTLLPSGDVALTRRASGHSKVRAVVLEWTQRRKRYERRGTLVETVALERARIECAADDEQRASQREAAAVQRAIQDRQYITAFTNAVRAMFPGCPLSEARVIAEHACEKHSGRVGRTAAAKELDPEKVRLAVIAHVRHLHTDYDQIIARTHDKRDSRARIKGGVAEVLREWQSGSRT